MRKISLWGRHHKHMARFSIVIIYVLLNGLGIVVGILLDELKFTFSTSALPVFISIFLAGIVFYPSNYHRLRLNKKAFYLRQKLCDFILVSSSFCLVVFLANRPEKLVFSQTTIHAATTEPLAASNDSTIKTYKTIPAFSASIKDENGKTLKWKERKKLLKEQIRGIKKAKDLSDGDKAALIILSVIVALGLLALVAALACNLSCSGADGAAVLVGIGGTALVIFLLVIVIRAIKGKTKKRKKELEKAASGA